MKVKIFAKPMMASFLSCDVFDFTFKRLFTNLRKGNCPSETPPHFIHALLLCDDEFATSVTSSGISVQGIARDGDGNPFANVSNLNANISLYYIDNNNVIIPKFTGVQLSTDSNGVFSYVYEVGASYFRSFEKESLYIWRGTGSPSSPQITFLNEKLSAVPYAIYAHNASPTGITLPFTPAKYHQVGYCVMAALFEFWGL